MKTCDQTALRKLVHCLLQADAVCLARQRGPEYNFGVGNNDHPQNVTNKLCPDKQHLLDTIPPDNLESEHYFGDFMQRLSKCGNRYVDHISECITISSSSDLAFKSHDWKTKEFSNTFKNMMNCRKTFVNEQKLLREISTNDQLETAEYITEGRKKAAIIQRLKEHGGPVTSTEDIDSILARYPGWENLDGKCKDSKALKQILRKEVTHARDYIFDTMKKVGNPLFKLNHISIQNMVENLKVLYGERGQQITANIDDVHVALDCLLNNTEEGKNNSRNVTQCTPDKEDNRKLYIKVNDAVVFKKDQNLGVGIVEEVEQDELKVVPLDKVQLPQRGSASVGKLWRYPENINLIGIHISNIIPCFPTLELDTTLSRNTRQGQKIVFCILNEDILRLFCNSS